MGGIVFFDTEIHVETKKILERGKSLELRNKMQENDGFVEWNVARMTENPPHKKAKQKVHRKKD